MNKKSKRMARSVPARHLQQSEQTRRNGVDNKEDRRLARRWALNYEALTAKQLEILDRHFHG